MLYNDITLYHSSLIKDRIIWEVNLIHPLKSWKPCDVGLWDQALIMYSFTISEIWILAKMKKILKRKTSDMTMVCRVKHINGWSFVSPLRYSFWVSSSPHRSLMRFPVIWKTVSHGRYYWQCFLKDNTGFIGSEYGLKNWLQTRIFSAH